MLKLFYNLKQRYDLLKTQFWWFPNYTMYCERSLVQVYNLQDQQISCLKVFGEGCEASKYYKMLLEYGGNQNVAVLKFVWERDLVVSFEGQEWNEICSNSRKMSREMRVRLIHFKIFHCFYWTPSRFHRLGLKDSAVCRKGGGDEGIVVHVLWTWPKNHQFWRKIHCYTVNVIKMQFGFWPKLYILGDSNTLFAIPQSLKYWIQTAIMIGWQIILRNWKMPGEPPLQEWMTE